MTTYEKDLPYGDESNNPKRNWDSSVFWYVETGYSSKRQTIAQIVSDFMLMTEQRPLFGLFDADRMTGCFFDGGQI